MKWQVVGRLWEMVVWEAGLNTWQVIVDYVEEGVTQGMQYWGHWIWVA